ncbi:MAG TPA: biotin/lipoyl-containing protein, partial [Allosphingosinicella sp.]
MIDILVPAEQEGTQAVVRAWLRQVGDRIEQHDPLVELETDKVTMEVPAPAAGVLREILLDSGAEAVPGAVLGRIAAVAEVSGHEGGTDGDSKPFGLSLSKPSLSSSAAEGKDRASTRSARTELRELRLSPSVKRALLQHDIDPARIE